MSGIKEKQSTIFKTFKNVFSYINTMQSPQIVKVVVSTGTGKITDKKKLELIQDRLSKITGQKPSARKAKQSIAAFKLREGDVVGYQVTMRGKRMFDFLSRLIDVALPRTRDFRGLPITSIDEMGNYTIGIREHTIFPETSDEDLKDVFGFAITIVTTAKSKKETEALLRHIGLPLKEVEKTEK